jgi:uncharacterized Ntn-hydrolase superfamily protein
VTWSILARDPDTGKFGIAVATKFFAVGALVPHARAGVGAVATQALINPFFGLDGLKLLQDGSRAADVVAKLVAGDEGRDHRQVHVIDAQGRTGAHTGQSCVDWCGAISERDLSVAGNMLANANVVAATASTFRSQAALPLAQRLIAAMKAGEAAGGDKRGKQSAALLLQGDEAWPDLSLRVDDHTDPLGELERLEAVSRERFVHFVEFLPSRRDRVGQTDRGVIEAGITKALAQPSAQSRS